MTNYIPLKGILNKIYDKVFIALVFCTLISATLFFGSTGLCDNFNNKVECVASAGQVNGADIGNFQCNRKTIKRGDNLNCSAFISGGVPPYNNVLNKRVSFDGSTTNTDQEVCTIQSNFIPNSTWDMGNGATPVFQDTYRQFENFHIDQTTWSVVDIGDWNGNGQENILFYNTAAKSVVIWDTYEGEYDKHITNTTGGGTLFVLGTNQYLIGMGDFDGNGLFEFATHDTNTGDVYFYFLSADLKSIVSNSYISNVPGSQWAARAIADFNGDGKSDIIWQYILASPAQAPVIWFMNGTTVTSGAYITGSPLPSPVDWLIIDAKDTNGDGKADILWQGVNTSVSTSVLYWYMNGTSYLSQSPSTTVLPNWRAQALGDLIDGAQPDIFFRSEVERPTILCNRINTGNTKVGNNNIFFDGIDKGDVFVTASSEPETFIVNQNKEYGPNSLTRALRVANNNGPSKDRIEFDFPVNTPISFDLDYNGFIGVQDIPAPEFLYDPFEIYNPVEIDGSTHMSGSNLLLTLDGKGNNTIDFVDKTNSNKMFEGADIPIAVNPALPIPGYIQGWAIDKNDQSKPVDLALYVGSTLYSMTKTGIPQTAIQAQYGLDTDKIGYRFNYPPILCDGVTRSYEIRAMTYENGDYEVINSGTFSRTAPSCSFNSITGGVEGVTARGGIKGFAFNTDNTPKLTQVMMYIDGTGPGNATNGAYTVINRPDINTTYGVQGNKGFEIEIPSSFCNSATHTAYIYGVSGNQYKLNLIGTQTFNLAPANCVTDFSSGVLAVGPSGNVFGYAYDVDNLTTNINVDLYNITNESPTVSRSYNGSSSSIPGGQNYFNMTNIGLTQTRGFIIDINSVFKYGIDNDYEVKMNQGSFTEVALGGNFSQTRIIKEGANKKYAPSGSKINHFSIINGGTVFGRYSLGIKNSITTIPNSPIAEIEVSNNYINVLNNGVTFSNTQKGMYIETASTLTQHNHIVQNNVMAGGNSVIAFEMNHLGCIYCASPEISGHSQMKIKNNKFGVNYNGTASFSNSNVILERFGSDSRFQNKTGSLFEGNEVFGQSTYVDGDGALFSDNYFGITKQAPYLTRQTTITARMDNLYFMSEWDAMPNKDGGVGKIFENNDVTAIPVYYNELNLVNRKSNVLLGSMTLAGKNNHVYGNKFGENDVAKYNTGVRQALNVVNDTTTFTNPVEVRDNKIAGNKFHVGGVGVYANTVGFDSTQVVRNEYENIEAPLPGEFSYPGIAINLNSGPEPIDSNDFFAQVTKNDIGDVDNGPNELTNAPVIVGYTNDGTNIRVRVIEHAQTVVGSTTENELVEIYIADDQSNSRYKPGETYLFTCDTTNRTVLNTSFTYTNIDGNSDTGQYIECVYPIADLPVIPISGEELAVLSVDQYCTIGTAGNDKCRPSSEFGVNIINNLGVEVQSSGGGNSNTSTVGGVHKVGNFTYTLTPRNDSGDNTLGTITVDYTLDTSKLNYVSASGSGWSCGFSTPVVSCTSESTINSGAYGNPIVVTVNTI